MIKIPSIETILALLCCESVAEIFALVEQHPELLSDEVGKSSGQLISRLRTRKNAEGKAMANKVEEQLGVLQDLRDAMAQTGLSAAEVVPAIRQGQEIPLQDISAAIIALVNANNWGESKRIVKEQRDLLLMDAADQIFADLLEEYKDDRNSTRRLEECRQLLARCHQVGIDAAFADHLRSSQSPSARSATHLRHLLNKINRLTRPQQMQRCVKLCRRALALVAREEEPELWATLQVKLANSLFQTPLGNRTRNIEQAISHYSNALEVYTQKAFPAEWASTINSLALANKALGSK